MIVRVNVVLNRTIADTDCCFDNLAVVIFRVKVSCITSGLYRNDVLQKSNENVGGGGGSKRKRRG